jgi:NADPH:quinone reductase-like Zn-dependent oxidoreductase
LQVLGAEEVFDYHSIADATLGRFEVILDTVGRDLAPFRRLLARKGRMATLALGGAGDVLYLLVSSIHGSRRVRFVQSPPDGRILADLATLVDAGKIRPVIAGTYPLAEAARAHRALEAGGGFGKRVLVVDGEGVP